MQIQPIPKTATLSSLPPEWPDDLRATIRGQVEASGRTIVALDDDPTGTQTVHDVPVLTGWGVDVLAAELARKPACFYVLTNSRALPAPEAAALGRTIGRNLAAASAQTGRDVAVVSRSDSTLRGHYPAETDALAEGLGQAVDGTLIVPFFLEGGRYTIDNIHWVAEGDTLVPASQTPYAADKAFGYANSEMTAWVEEKTGGRVRAGDVAAVTLDDLRVGGPDAVRARLQGVSGGQVCVVNCASYRDMEVFVLGLLAAEAAGKRFLYRTAASFVQVRAGLPARPLLTADDLELPPSGGGLFVVGSYVPKTTAQLHALLAQPGIVPVEIDVVALLDDRRADTLAAAIRAVDAGLAADQTVALFTSRQLVTVDDHAGSLSIGRRVSDGLIEIVQKISQRPRYLVAKGGITSSDTATGGLGVVRATVAGQILPGIPVWRTGAESRHPGLVYIVFPGNVGGDDALAEVESKLRVA
ncbi:MAG: four-carbon acid sugar kinase family protein [Caldilineaceae bacterium]